jgi:ABC-type Mn2+/Zn2+ transport system permease subunit
MNFSPERFLKTLISLYIFFALGTIFLSQNPNTDIELVLLSPFLWAIEKTVFTLVIGFIIYCIWSVVDERKAKNLKK